jgi:hypothetical protein
LTTPPSSTTLTGGVGSIRKVNGLPAVGDIQPKRAARDGGKVQVAIVGPGSGHKELQLLEAGELHETKGRVGVVARWVGQVNIHYGNFSVLAEEIFKILSSDRILVPAGEVADKGKKGSFSWEGDWGGVVVGPAIVVAAVIAVIAGLAAAAVHIVPAAKVIETIIAAVSSISAVASAIITPAVVAITPISTP